MHALYIGTLNKEEASYVQNTGVRREVVVSMKELTTRALFKLVDVNQ
jgi:hypothetical protein